MIFDLNGFKGYNDSFGHPAGDALLARLGGKLAAIPGEAGAAYRLGGDEFCLIATISDGQAESVIEDACGALAEQGEGFEISTSFGAIMLPDEATDASEACTWPTSGCTRRSTRAAARQARPCTHSSTRSRTEPGLHDHSRGGRLARGRDRADARPAPRRARGSLARRPAPRPRRARRSRRDPPQAGTPRRARVGVHPPAHARRRTDPARVAAFGASPRSSARRTSAGTAPAIPTASRARTSRSRPGSSAPADAFPR